MSNRPSFEVFKKDRTLSTASDLDLEEEIEDRKRKLFFPLDCFNPKIKPFLETMVKDYDLPRSFVGLAMLTVYSSAIGSSYKVTTNYNDGFSLAMWSCFEGISSSGKSLVLGKIFNPLNEIQKKFDRDWADDTAALSKEERMRMIMKTVIFRDVHVPTLARTVIPDNPKGVTKFADEFLEFINGMNALSNKEGTDEQFWLSSWNGTPYSGIRSGKDKFVLPRLFLNVVGGIQSNVIHKLFAKDRDTTGFVFRMLFAVPERQTVCLPNPFYEFPKELQSIHNRAIERLYHDNPVDVLDAYETPNWCKIEKYAIQELFEWSKDKKATIDAIEDVAEKNLQAGIFGKMKEYAQRIAGMLALADIAYTNEPFPSEVIVRIEVMHRALKIVDYFYNSASHVSNRVKKEINAPLEALQVQQVFLKTRSIKEASAIYFREDSDAAYKRFQRLLNKYIKNYPFLFNTQDKSKK